MVCGVAVCLICFRPSTGGLVMLVAFGIAGLILVAVSLGGCTGLGIFTSVGSCAGLGTHGGGVIGPCIVGVRGLRVGGTFALGEDDGGAFLLLDPVHTFFGFAGAGFSLLL